MTKFKDIKNIHEELAAHNKNLLFLKLNKQLKLFILSMPPDIKYKLTQKGVVCDVYTKFDRNYFRIRVYHPTLAQDIRNDSTKRAILNHINNYKRFSPIEARVLNLRNDEIIINSNAILNTYIDYEKSRQPKILLKDLMCEDFNNLAKLKEHQILVDNLKESIKKTNAKIKSIRQN